MEVVKISCGLISFCLFLNSRLDEELKRITETICMDPKLHRWKSAIFATALFCPPPPPPEKHSGVVEATAAVGGATTEIGGGKPLCE